jgi:hypothetical protein
MKRFLLRAVIPALFVLSGLSLACTLGRAAHRALPSSAVLALAEARELARQRPARWEERAEEALARASQAAPGWVAPARFHDDLRREALLGHLALAERRAALAESGSPQDRYLVARLEGRAGAVELERAARQDPTFAFGQHGLAWLCFQEGDVRGAFRFGRRALALARGSYELGTFSLVAARYAREDGRTEEALEILRTSLTDERLAEPERTEVEVALAEAELEDDDEVSRERGFWRAVRLLESGRLTPGEIDGLGEVLLGRRLRADVPDPLGVVLAALPDSGSPPEERLRARLLLERGAHALAGVAWEHAHGSLQPGAFQRARDLERGEAARALGRWNEDLPARLRGGDGLPREPRLRELVLASRETSETGGAERFGAALLAAGWFEEAESWASALALRAREPALALASRAAAGQALLAGVRDTLARLDEGRSAFLVAGEREGGEARSLDSLEDVLQALQGHFERYRGAPLATPLVDSPRLSFGALASVVHPGPVFSREDERLGRGAAGADVPGLAHELAHLGRFGIFGSAPGTRPDGAVLRLVGGEWREGTHLGVPFTGWVAWCEGADLESRPGRLGSGVSGAALHEGYWIDLERVRRDFERVRALETRYLEAAGGGLARALSERGPRLPREHGPDERMRWMAPLGEGERVLLAALAEREPEVGGGRLGFDEWLDLTCLHEEGHLTDRTRFLPLLAHWPRVLGFLLRHGLAPRAVARALEYRAQLVALCEAPDPRLVLAECLQAAESEGGVLAHGEAYRELVQDFLRELAPLDPLPGLDSGYYVLYQLHFLAAADVRRAALALAERHGMLSE